MPALRLVPANSEIIEPTPQVTLAPFTLGRLIDTDLQLSAGPVYLPLQIMIPALKVIAPILGVGLNAESLMDAPKGPIGAAVWSSAFWYRGGGIPGDIGTATIAAHVNDPLGVPEIFANLAELRPGDQIIIHALLSEQDIVFVVEEVKVYSLAESIDPLVLSLIYGAGPVAGLAAQPSLDGLSHLTLVTCAGYIVNGEFDHHTVVFATRSE